MQKREQINYVDLAIGPAAVVVCTKYKRKWEQKFWMIVGLFFIDFHPANRN
jgi:hypothetical protein